MSDFYVDSFCQAQNIPAGAALSEYSPGQFEINLNHIDDPVLAYDHAVLLKRAVKAGIHHGITNQLEPGPMVAEKQKFDYEITLPVRWSKSLDAFRAGGVLPQYFGEEYHRLFEICRREESELFHSQVTNRDYEWYLRAV